VRRFQGHLDHDNGRGASKRTKEKRQRARGDHDLSFGSGKTETLPSRSAIIPHGKTLLTIRDNEIATEGRIRCWSRNSCWDRRSTQKLKKGHTPHSTRTEHPLGLILGEPRPIQSSKRGKPLSGPRGRGPFSVLSSHLFHHLITKHLPRDSLALRGSKREET